MIHVIAAVICGNRNQSRHNSKSHDNQTEEPLRKDEKIIMNIAYWAIVLTIAFVLGYVKVILKNG